MKPTHSFKNPQIGFGEEQGGAREVLEQSWYQSQQTTSLLSNEHESWSISQPKSQRTVMETQQRMGRQRYLT